MSLGHTDTATYNLCQAPHWNWTCWQCENNQSFQLDNIDRRTVYWHALVQLRTVRCKLPFPSVLPSDRPPALVDASRHGGDWFPHLDPTLDRCRPGGHLKMQFQRNGGRAQNKAVFRSSSSLEVSLVVSTMQLLQHTWITVWDTPLFCWHWDKPFLHGAISFTSSCWPIVWVVDSKNQTAYSLSCVGMTRVAARCVRHSVKSVHNRLFCHTGDSSPVPFFFFFFFALDKDWFYETVDAMAQLCSQQENKWISSLPCWAMCCWRQKIAPGASRLFDDLSNNWGHQEQTQ